MKRNISVPLDKVEAYLKAFAHPDSVTPEQQAKIALDLHRALQKSHEKLLKGFEDQNLTVCTGRAGYADPKDMQRLLSGEIPRLTLYRAKKPAHNMRVYIKGTPSSHKRAEPCKTAKKSTSKPSTAPSRKAAPRKRSSTAKPVTS